MRMIIAAVLALSASPAIAQTASTPAAPMTGELELAPYLPMEDQGICRLGPQGEGRLALLLSYDERVRTWKARGSLPLPDGTVATPTVKTTAVKDVEGATSITSVTRLPPGTTWNGLPLSSITLMHIAVPESDDSDWRTFTFDVPASTLRSKLRAMGQDFPVSPLYRSIETPEDACGAAASIEADGNRSNLTCSRGC